MKRSLFSFALLALSLAAAGCGGAGSLCDDICDCTGECSENDRDECYDDIDDAERHADDEGCSEQFDEYASCLSSEFECRDGRVDADGCRSAAEDLDDCQRGRSGGGGDGF